MADEEAPAKRPIEPSSASKTPTLPEDRAAHLKKQRFFCIRSKQPATPDTPVAKKSRLIPIQADPPSVKSNATKSIERAQASAALRRRYHYIKVKPDPATSGSNSSGKKYSCRYVTMPTAYVKKVAPSPSDENALDFHPSSSCSPNEILMAMVNVSTTQVAPKISIAAMPTARIVETKNYVPSPFPKEKPDISPSCFYSPNEILRPTVLQPFRIPVTATSAAPVAKIEIWKSTTDASTKKETSEILASSSSAIPVVETKNSTSCPTTPEKKKIRPSSPTEKPDLLPSASVSSPKASLSSLPSHEKPLNTVPVKCFNKKAPFLCRGLPVPDMASADYIMCRLCVKYICNSRRSNFWEHAKRHCASKRFLCSICGYQISEKSRILHHMVSHHDKNSSDFLDTGDAHREAWTALMHQCFPGFLDEKVPYADLLRSLLRRTEIASEKSAKEKNSGNREGSGNSLDIDFKNQLESLYTCSVCNEAVIVEGKDPKTLIFHLYSKHRELCVLYKCAICEYENPDKKVATWHLNTRHETDSKRKVEVLPADPKNLGKLMHKFFPSVENMFGRVEDADESSYKADFLRAL